jgi:hypothetical protein
LNGKPDERPREAFCEFHGCHMGLYSIRMLQTDRYKYIRNYYPNKPYVLWRKYMNKMPTKQEMLRLKAEGELIGHRVTASPAGVTQGKTACSERSVLIATWVSSGPYLISFLVHLTTLTPASESVSSFREARRSAVRVPELPYQGNEDTRTALQRRIRGNLARSHPHLLSPQERHVRHPSIITTAAVLHFRHSCAPAGKPLSVSWANASFCLVWASYSARFCSVSDF